MIEDDVGRAERHWTFELPGLLAESAARNVLAAGGSLETVEPVIAELPGLLAEVRRLIAGETGRAYVGAAFAGIRVPEGTRLRTPFGVLRSAAEPERSHRPGGSPEAWTILEKEIPFTWNLGERPEGTKLKISQEFRAAEENMNRLPLAGLLALGEDAVPRLTWFYVRAPLRRWGPSGWPVRLGWGDKLQEPDPLDPDRQIELAEWCRRVDEHHTPTIAIAERRVISAVTDRPYSDEDALIDAVIAWENLFGHGSNVEMTFRVTTALAILLEADPTKRRELAAELRKIYGDRSTVAHGSKLSDKRDLRTIRSRAIELTVAAFRGLFRDRPDLLSDRDRGMCLVLEGRPDNPSAN